MNGSFSRRIVLLSLSAVLGFAVFFLLVTWLGRWPGLPYREIRDVDLAVGFAAAAAFGWTVFRPGARR